MRQLLLLLLSLVVSVGFLAFPEEGQWGYLFSEVKHTPKSWVYYLCEHLRMVVLGVAIARYEKKYHTTVVLFVCLEVADTIDYVLTYAEPWLVNRVTFNTIKICTLGASIAYDYVKTHVGNNQSN